MDDITLSGTTVDICGLQIEDASLAQLLGAHSPDEWPDVISRALVVGAHTLLMAGIAIDLGDIDTTVRRVVQEATAVAEERVQSALEAGRSAMAADLDPGHRDSLVAQALADFEEWRTTTTAALDPDIADSSAARLLAGLGDQLAAFQGKLAQALDPTEAGSGFATLSDQMETLFRELFSQLGRDQGQREEAAIGTAKGVDFEDVVEQQLRRIARAIGGAVVERTSRTGGNLGNDALVGDFVVTLASGHRVVVEAKNKARLGLHGAGGILAELERARSNRSSEVAVCVSALDAFPDEVGPFARYGEALLIVDDGSGQLLEPAVRWAAALAQASSDSGQLSAIAVTEALDRIRSKARQLSDAKRALTEVGKSVASVQDTLDALRRELIEAVDDAAMGLRPPEAEAA